MRILLLGAYGFIGSAIARELIARGHDVTGLGRDTDYGHRILPQARWVRADLALLTSAASWDPLLEGVDAVVNASGQLQSGDGGDVAAVQLHAIRALVKACEAAGLRRYVQISAAGADLNATTDFMATKAQADAVVEASTVPSLVLRPGLVIGRNSFGGTEFVRIAAAAPVELRLPLQAPIQCTALSDLVKAVAEGLELDSGRTGCFDLVERRCRSLDEIIAVHRAWLGLRTPRFTMTVPRWFLRLLSATADLFGTLGWRSPLRRNALMALTAGVVGNPEHGMALLNREPISLEATLAGHAAGKQDRLQARLGLVQPLLIAALFVMWAASGAATLLQLDQAASILEPSGIEQRTARAVTIGGGWIDIVLAAGLLWRRTVRGTLLAMILLTVFAYLVGGTVLVPHLWIDPLAPFAKAIPSVLLALVAYWMLEKR